MILSRPGTIVNKNTGRISPTGAINTTLYSQFSNLDIIPA